MDTDIKTRVFFFAKALFMPKAVSARNILVKNPFFSFLRLCEQPPSVTALTGETRDAFFAGAKEAIKTVSIPIIIPASIPTMLILNNGISAKKLLL